MAVILATSFIKVSCHFSGPCRGELRWQSLSWLEASPGFFLQTHSISSIFVPSKWMSRANPTAFIYSYFSEAEQEEFELRKIHNLNGNIYDTLQWHPEVQSSKSDIRARCLEPSTDWNPQKKGTQRAVPQNSWIQLLGIQLVPWVENIWHQNRMQPGR